MSMKSPAINNYLDWLGRIEYRNVDNTFTYDKRSYKLIDELFTYLRMLEPINEHGTKELWLTSGRGTIDDFEDLDEAIADGAVKNAKELNDWWLDLFPEEEQWYHLMAGESTDLGYKSIFINNRQIIEVDSTKERGFEHDISEFLEWMLSAVKRCIDELKDGTYNERINKGVPYEYKIGTIVRNDLYDIFPDLRKQFFADISKTEISEFIDLASKQSRNRDNQRIHRFTANEFYKCCALGYKENEYEFTDLSPKEQYYKHSDGRDDGLSEIDGDSVEEYIKWYHRSQIGHPWEVCRGGNSTHVSLYVDHNDKGFCLLVEGSSITRCIEAIKFYLALKRAGYPVNIVNAEELIARLNETEIIGIVPIGVIPLYCGGYFPNEKIIDFMNLPFEERSKVVEKCIWKPLREIRLINID
ncbi:MAG: hypothetical protein E7494_07720 [Ruminococcus albus]|nr:hypothetical protein [Ruminococcus albus]